MGIPLWREPSESETSKSALERDASAAARSAIRRHTSVRRPSRHSARARPGGTLSSFHSQILDEIQRGVRGTGESQPGVRSSVLNWGMSADGYDLDWSRRDAYRRENAARAGMRPGDRRPGTNQNDTLSDLPTRPESLFQPGNRFNLSSSHPESQLQPALARLSSPRPSFTPSFAPAISYHTTATSQPSQPSPDDSPRIRALSRLRAPMPELASSDSSSATLRNLVLEAHANRALGSGVDGLGDRQRSVSLGGDGESDEWEPMFTTITPDIHLPSNDTSFSSLNAAPDTDAARNRPSQPNANQPERMYPVRVTLPMGLDTYPDHLNPCDLSSSDDDDEEDTPVNYHRIIGPSGRPIALRRSPGHNSTMSSHPPIPTIPTISFSFSDVTGDTHLQQMQAILDRLARREDIPDDWWAGAGLSRNMGRGLNTGANPPNGTSNGTAFD